MTEPETPPANEPADQTPEPPAPEPPAAPDAATPPASPWANDLESAFDDPEVRGRVDEFLRTNVQPHVTKLEQATVPNRNAERLWNDFRENPTDTLLAVATELYGADQTEQLRSVLSGDEPAEPTEGTPPVSDDLEKLDFDELPPDVKEAVDYYRNQQRSDAWENALTKLREDNPDVEIDETLFTPFASVADGDLDRALVAYKEWTANAAEKFGGETPPAPEGEEDEGNDPPPTIGGDSRAPTTPPVESKPETLDEAIDDLYDEMQRAKQPEAPPVVGA